MVTRKTFVWIVAALMALVLLIGFVAQYVVTEQKKEAEKQERKIKQDTEIKQFVEERKAEAEKRRNLVLKSGDKVVSLKISGGFGLPVQEAPNAVSVKGYLIKDGEIHGGLEVSIYLKNDSKEAVTTEVMLADSQSGLKMTGKVKLEPGEGKPISMALMGQSQHLYILIPPGKDKEDD